MSVWVVKNRQIFQTEQNNNSKDEEKGMAPQDVARAVCSGEKISMARPGGSVAMVERECGTAVVPLIISLADKRVGL